MSGQERPTASHELHVVFRHSGRAGQEVIAVSPVVRFGRALDADVLFDETTDRVVSRNHAEVRWEDGRPVLYAAPGKAVLRDGAPVAGPTPLSSGDVLEFAGLGGPSVEIYFEPETLPPEASDLVATPRALQRRPEPRAAAHRRPAPEPEPEPIPLVKPAARSPEDVALPPELSGLGLTMFGVLPPGLAPPPHAKPSAQEQGARHRPGAASPRREPAPTPAPDEPAATSTAVAVVEIPVPGGASLPPVIVAPEPPAAPPAPPPPEPTAPPRPGLSGGIQFAKGQTLAGRYRVEEKIGQGGMAAVFRVTDLELGEQVALKLFLKKSGNARVLARFKQELVLSRRLNHPGIVRLYDIGSLDGMRYITMELLQGADLERPHGVKFELADGLDYLVQVSTALQHAHDEGVIHRDIKPANLFLTNKGVVKLTDFGLAKNRTGPGLTVAGVTGGTPEYMSPEQIGGFGTVTGSTDLYAMGIVAYRFFTGTVPFQHRELIQLMFMQVRDKPRPPREHDPNIPADLERIILKLLEKDPANRHPDARSLAAELDTVRRRYPKR